MDPTKLFSSKMATSHGDIGYGGYRTSAMGTRSTRKTTHLQTSGLVTVMAQIKEQLERKALEVDVSALYLAGFW